MPKQTTPRAGDKRLSLPMDFEEAVAGLLGAPPPAKDKRAKGKRARKPKQPKAKASAQ